MSRRGPAVCGIVKSTQKVISDQRYGEVATRVSKRVANNEEK